MFGIFDFVLKQGLPLVAELIHGKSDDEAINVIREETGIQVIKDPSTGNIKINQQDILALKELETKLELEKLHLEHEEKMQEGEYNFALKGQANEIEQIKFNVEALKAEVEDRKDARDSHEKMMESDSWLTAHFLEIYTFIMTLVALGTIVYVAQGDIITKHESIGVMIMTAAIGWISSFLAFWVGSNKANLDASRQANKGGSNGK
jgi:hypothetical protein